MLNETPIRRLSKMIDINFHYVTENKM